MSPARARLRGSATPPRPGKTAGGVPPRSDGSVARAARTRARRSGRARTAGTRAPPRGRRPVRACTSSSPTCRDARPCSSGRSAPCAFERGWYAYVGSAARARRARVARHLAAEQAAALARRLPLRGLPGAPRLARGRRRGRVRARRRSGGAARRGAPPAPLRRRRLPLRRPPGVLPPAAPELRSRRPPGPAPGAPLPASARLTAGA